MRRDLQGLVDNFEDILNEMADATGDQASTLKRRADKQLREVRLRLSQLEHSAAGGMRRVGRGTRDYASGHPWIILGTVLAAALAVGIVARIRS